MHSGVPIFKIGEMILVGASKEQKIRAQIVSFRSVDYPDMRSKEKRYGCDVITEELGVRWYPLEDIVKWNPQKVREWFK